MLQDDLTANGISNIATTYESSTISIGSVVLDASAGESFSAVIQPVDDDTLELEVTGTYKQLSRTIRVNYDFGARVQTVFDYGVATRGPLHLAGNIELEGTNVSVEASVYIETEGSDVALSITGNSQVAGDVCITDSDAAVDLQGGQASIGGETGQDAIDNHVVFGAPPTEFPTPDPDYFEHYAINIIDSSTDTSLDTTFENVKIAAGTNPTFSGNVTLNGVVFIETPNVVTFTGNASVTAIIVGDGEIEDNSGTNQINFLGNVSSNCVSELPSEEQFSELREETGTFIVAPGFSTSFGGSFDALSGAIASNGIEFFGNAGGTINGSIINYSDEPMTFTGNSDLYFNRSGTAEIPAGFIPQIILVYQSPSYSEIVL